MFTNVRCDVGSSDPLLMLHHKSPFVRQSAQFALANLKVAVRLVSFLVVEHVVVTAFVTHLTITKHGINFSNRNKLNLLLKI